MEASLFPWKSPSKSREGRAPPAENKTKLKPEKFSYANSINTKDSEPLPLESSLQSGLKLFVKERESVGFDNCVIWLKSDNLEIWIPSTGKYQIISLPDIKMIAKAHQEKIIRVKCSKDLEYQFKASTESTLEQLRLLLKFSTAKKILSSDIQSSSIVSESFPQTITDENLEQSNSQFEMRNSGRRLSLRSPNLKSPACSKDRIGARLRLRSRTSVLASPRDSFSSKTEELQPSVFFEENSSPKISPKRLREDGSGQSLSISKKIRHEGKRMRAEDDIIVGNETVTL